MAESLLTKATPYLIIVIVLLGVGLLVPSLWSGMMVDDYFHWVLATGNPVFQGIAPSQPTGLFSFLDGNAERTLQMINAGFLPWWTDPNIKLSFWRPLAEFTHWVDYYLWPDNAFLMHLHSLVYLLVLLVCAVYLYRQTFQERGAWLLASLIFALSYTHAFPTSWIVNRNALLISIFLVLTVALHQQWRENGDRIIGALALFCFVLSLLSGEMGVSTGLYLFAYACVFESGIKPRIVSLLPYVMAGIIWLTFRAWLGYGAAYSNHYLDPIASPDLYLQALPGRLYQFLIGLFVVVPPTFQSRLPDWSQWVLPATLAVIFLLSVPLLKHSRWARFWLLSALLSLLPIACTIPGSGRLLIVSSIGVSAFIGMLIQFTWQQQAVYPVWARMLVVPMLLIVTLLHLPLTAVINVKTTLQAKESMDIYLNQPALSWDVAADAETAILVNAPLTSFASFIKGIQSYNQRPVADQMWALASGSNRLTVTTVDEYTLEIMSPKGLYSESEMLFRSRQVAFRAGDQVELDGLTVQIEAVGFTGIPTHARFRFHTKLEGDQYQVLHWHRSAFKPCRLPREKTTMELSLSSSYCT